MTRKEAMGRPRVLVVGPTPPPTHGAAVFTRTVLDAPRLRDEFRLEHLDTSDPRPGENMGRLESENVRLALTHLGRLARRVAGEGPDLLYLPVSQNRWAYLRDGLFIALARAFGVPVLTHLHGSHFRAFHRDASAPMRRFVVATTRRLQGAIVLGEALREQYEGWLPPARIHVVPNGVPDPWDGQGEEAREDGAPEDDPPAGPRSGSTIIGYLGALRAERGVERLVEGCAGLEEARLVLAGGWRTEAYRKRVEETIRATGMGGRVAFPGVLRGADKEAFYRGIDLFALATDRGGEGQPLVILEAMARGLPVVATRWGAIPETVVDGETGLVVPPGDTGTLTDALMELAADPDLRRGMGRAGRARYEERFTVERSMDRLADAFRATIAAGDGPRARALGDHG